jgi:hypothetical protein
MTQESFLDVHVKSFSAKEVFATRVEKTTADVARLEDR